MSGEQDDNTCQRCGGESSGELHECPYAYEIGGVDCDTYCNCCDFCTNQCAMDV